MRGHRIRNFVARQRDTLGFYLNLVGEYGPIVRYKILGYEFCLVSDAELIEEVLFAKRKTFQKGFIYKRSLLFPRPTLLTGDGDDHKQRRRLVQPYFHRKLLSTYSAIMAEEALTARDSWQEGECFDVYQMARGLTLAISLRIFYGSQMDVDTETLRDVMDFCVIDFGLTMLPSPAIRRLILNSFRRLRRTYWGVSEKVEAMAEVARADDVGERHDLVSYLARTTTEDGEFAFDDDEVFETTVEMLAASIVTSTVTITWATYYMAQYPHVRERLEREVDEVLGDRIAGFDDLGRLEYTGAVIDEVLRLAPSSHYIGRQALDDLTIGDYFIPKGSNVQLFFYPPQRDERFFPDPEVFRPGRWLEEQPDRPRCAYMPFSVGNRSCAGEAFARMMLKFALASIAQRWRLEPVSTEFPKLKTLVSLDFKDGLDVRARSRKGAS